MEFTNSRDKEIWNIISVEREVELIGISDVSYW